MLNAGLGVDCGIDLEALAKAGQCITNELGRENNSKCGRAVKSKMKELQMFYSGTISQADFEQFPVNSCNIVN
jgi:hypothetical protein